MRTRIHFWGLVGAVLLAPWCGGGGQDVELRLFFQLDDATVMRLWLYQNPPGSLCDEAPMRNAGPWSPTSQEHWGMLDSTRGELFYGENSMELNPGDWGFVFRAGNDAFPIESRDLARGCAVADLDSGMNPNVNLTVIRPFWPGVCGDGALDENEMCDDHNTNPTSDTDHCSEDCLSTPVRVLNVIPDANQYEPDLAAFPGGFYLVYSNDASSVEDSNHVKSVKLDAWGMPQMMGAVPEIKLNDMYWRFSQERPAVAANSGFMTAVWLDFDASTDDGDVRIRRINTDTGSGAVEVTLNETTANTQIDAVIGGNGSSSSLIAAWTDNRTSPQDVICRRVEGGAPSGAEISCASDTTGDQSQPAVAMDSGGSYVVAWQSSADIYVRFFDAGGSASGPEVAANTSTGGEQTHPALAFDSEGRLLVVWRDGTAVRGRLFGSTGTADGDDFVISGSGITDSDNRGILSVAGDTGVFLVAWVAPAVGVAGRLVTGTDAFGVNRIVAADPGNEPFTDRGEFPVTESAYGGIQSAEVGVTSAGEAFVAWEDNTSGTLDIRGRIIPTT